MPYKYSGTPYSGVKYEPIVYSGVKYEPISYSGESLTEYQERMAKAAEEASESAEALQEGTSSINNLADKFKFNANLGASDLAAGLLGGLGGLAIGSGLGALAAHSLAKGFKRKAASNNIKVNNVK